MLLAGNTENMPKTESIHRAIVRSRRVPILIIGLTVLVVAATIGLTTRQVRAGIREQMVGRDAAVLHAVLTTHLDEQRSLDPLSQDPANQLTAVLVASRLKGVLGTRLFDPEGRLLEVFPPMVREGELLATNLAGFRSLQATGHFMGATASEEVFYSWEASGAREGILPLFVVEVPLHTTADQVLLGIAQFLIEGHTIQTDLARLDRQLAYQAFAAFGAASIVLTVSLGWAFRRLRRTHALLADKTRHLERANEELARAARTAAVGAITAHLIHGLRSPLTGLQHYVASVGDGESNPRSADWETAVRTTRRMQSLISEVVEVLREENTEGSYELSVGELLELVGNRVRPLAVGRGVRLESDGDLDLRLTNRTANLLKLILVNLTENAIHATPEGKCVRIEAEGGADSLRILVHDEGHGFPEPARGNVFCPRPSDREGGAGIGLAISKQLADYLGAELELRRSTARGCVFALSLQLDAWEKAAEAAGVAGEDHWVAMNHLGGGWPRLE